MANFVSARTEYYTMSQASGELKHVERAFTENKNVLGVHGDFVWRSCDLHAQFLALVQEAEKRKGKKFQINSNLYLDTVLVLSRELVEQLQNDLGDNFESSLRSCISDFEQRFKDAYGFTPVGYSFHGDEGHVHPVTNEVIRNYHFHVISLNFDFLTNTQPLRKMQLGDWSVVQDLAGHAFSSLGFVRGESKSKTKKKHLDKNSFIEQLLLEKEKIISDHKSIIQQQEFFIKENIEFIAKQKLNIKDGCTKLSLIDNDIKRATELLDKIKSNLCHFELLRTEVDELKEGKKTLEEANSLLNFELERYKLKCQRLEFECSKLQSNSVSRHALRSNDHSLVKNNRNDK
jgi:hypothetical protein